MVVATSSRNSLTGSPAKLSAQRLMQELYILAYT